MTFQTKLLVAALLIIFHNYNDNNTIKLHLIDKDWSSNQSLFHQALSVSETEKIFHSGRISAGIRHHQHINEFQISWNPISPLAKLVWQAGFVYDSTQDIIVSRMDALQRNLGYCWAYDMAAPTLGMIIDAEPIYFSYDSKQWMIELWKGQYGLECGGEIGVYNRPDHWWTPSNSGWFDCVNDEDRLLMKFTLYIDDKVLLTRGPERHWWLTGFKWGQFSEPENVKMEAEITLRDANMRNAFHSALSTTGYKNISVNGNTVGFTFAKPFTGQPSARYLLRDGSQANNQALVKAYNAARLAAGLKSNDPNKITAEAFPKVFQSIKDWIGLWHGWGPHVK